MNTKVWVGGAIGVLVLLNVVLLTVVFMGHQKMSCEGKGKHPYAQHHQMRPGGGDHPHHKMGHFMKKRLGFSDEQVQEAKAIKEKHTGFMRDKKGEMKALNQRYFDCLADEACQDEAQILAEIQSLHQELMANRYEGFSEMMAIAQPEQKDKVKQALIRMASHPPHGQRGGHKGKKW